ncbi:CDP-alcohol phosphatidyltransferase family protein [Streptomyces sp. NBC_01275]|uniref:CDP-alcohol phosphatidyltransferase family protein n=1 Tax=Streptomyces sp. NBC_01275 TaxID=2903807 RepID=UPI00224CF3D5|nr:CDP-alcohol phosphatidyltransferase family protein [Streptomyces sp. NBC_01275]MCX4766873.1 CDP-alcohol phosphatidyltransferase family protein [Streptomyces sp. NBC_01275]
MTEFAEALRHLSAAQKPAKGASLYTLFVNRPAGRVLAALAYRVGATPNQLTVLGALFTFPALAAVALLPPGPTMSVCIGAALTMGFALDAADGQLARGQRSGSPSGEWLDHVLDCVKIVALHLVVLVSFYRHFSLPGPAFLLVPMLFELVAVVTFFAGILTEKLRWRTAAGTPAGSPPALRSVLLLPVDYGLTCISFLFLGSQDVFLSVYCALLAAHTLFMAAFLVKWFRELS